jgi:hypothetical protein
MEATTKSPPAPLPTTGGHGNGRLVPMQAERTALSTAAVKREIRRIVAEGGHKLGSFDRRGLAVCEHCDATMVDDDACEHIERGADTLGSFAEPCCGDDPVQKAIHRIIWTARTLKPGTGFVCLAPCGMIVARSSTGLLRTGHYEAGMARWWRADVEQCIRESAEVLLDWRKCGYAAGDRRRSLDRDLGEIYRVEGIGREIVRLHA